VTVDGEVIEEGGWSVEQLKAEVEESCQTLS